MFIFICYFFICYFVCYFICFFICYFICYFFVYFVCYFICFFICYFFIYFVCYFICFFVSVISSVSVSSSSGSICPTCYQMPCVIIQAPSWLRGSAAPSLTIAAKRYSLYRRFWTLLGQLGVWNHPTYLAIKLAKTTGNDCRDVMPDCVIKVSL